ERLPAFRLDLLRHLAELLLGAAQHPNSRAGAREPPRGRGPDARTTARDERHPAVQLAVPSLRVVRHLMTSPGCSHCSRAAARAVGGAATVLRRRPARQGPADSPG